MPWPTTKPPRQCSPRRASASSFSSIAVDVPALVGELLRDRRAHPAAADDDRLHGSVSGTSRPPPGRPAGRRRPSPRTAPAAGRSRRRAEEARLAPPARRRAHHDQVGADRVGLVDDRLADRRARGRRRPRPRRRARAASSARLGERRVGSRASSVGSRASSGSPAAPGSRGAPRPPRPRSSASRIAVASTSSPMSPSFIGTRMRSELRASARDRSRRGVDALEQTARPRARRDDDVDDRARREPDRPGDARALVGGDARPRARTSAERRRARAAGPRRRGSRRSSGHAERPLEVGLALKRSRITASWAAVNASSTPKL